MHASWRKNIGWLTSISPWSKLDPTKMRKNSNSSPYMCTRWRPIEIKQTIVKHQYNLLFTSQTLVTTSVYRRVHRIYLENWQSSRERSTWLSSPIAARISDGVPPEELGLRVSKASDGYLMYPADDRPPSTWVKACHLRHQGIHILGVVDQTPCRLPIVSVGPRLKRNSCHFYLLDVIHSVLSSVWYMWTYIIIVSTNRVPIFHVFRVLLSSY
jgi:hypothetical protein